MPALRTLFLVLSLCSSLSAQPDTLLFTPVSGYAYPAPFSCYTARFDLLHRPYLYTANQEYGLIVFDYSNLQEIKPVGVLHVSQFQNLKPTDLVQEGNYLYVSLGGFAGVITQNAGLAIVDISDPAHPVITGLWTDPAFNKGCATVRLQGQHAYLGAMDKGVVLLNISNPAKPVYTSHVTLDLNWPAPIGLFSVPHARGLALDGNHLWTCFDAGSLRLVDIFDKQNPYEAYKYLNEDIDAAGRIAYNNAVVVGNYLYVAVDYCGLEIIDISNPNQPVNAGWENPWNCSKLNWDGRPGHTNQLVTACRDSLLFVSGADSEVLAYSLATPAQPRLLGQHAILKDSVATWGVDANDSLIVLAEIWNPLNTPYVAKKGGIQLLRWNCPATTAAPAVSEDAQAFSFTPNPWRRSGQLRYRLTRADQVQWRLYDVLGRPLLSSAPVRQEPGEHRITMENTGLKEGAYFIVLQIGNQTFSQMVLKQ